MLFFEFRYKKYNAKTKFTKKEKGAKASVFFVKQKKV